MDADKLNRSRCDVPLAFGYRTTEGATDRTPFTPRNRILAALPHDILSTLRPHLTPVTLARGGLLCEAAESRRRVYFVESGVVSLTTEAGTALILATVGREGAVGGPTVLLGGNLAFGRYQMLVSGSVLAMEAPRFRVALQDSLELRRLCEAYTQAFFVQVLETLACSRLHTADARCARWLLMCDDQTEDDTFELGEDSLAAMLGVSRSAAHAVASRLCNSRLIRLREGSITILDRHKLEAAACVCYRTIRHYYERPLAHA